MMEGDVSQEQVVEMLKKCPQTCRIVDIMAVLYGGRQKHFKTIAKRILDCEAIRHNRGKQLDKLGLFSHYFYWRETTEGDAYWRALDALRGRYHEDIQV